MTLIVEDGTGLATAQSYVSLVEANTYHQLYASAAWNADDYQKEVALRRATQYLDASYEWHGRKRNRKQALGWPRCWAEDTVEDLCIDTDVIPSKVKDATCVLALSALTGALLTPIESDSRVIRERIGEIEVEYDETRSYIPDYPFLLRRLSGLYCTSLDASSVKLRRS